MVKIVGLELLSGQWRWLAFLGLFSVLSCSRFSPNPQEYTEGGTVWVQRSGEYRALCYQAYHLAKLKLDAQLKVKRQRSPAIILDIDETVLDNSYYSAKNILIDRHYPEGWAEWEDLGMATAVPGSVEFVQYAASKGVEVFFITNRKERSLEITLKNLSDLGFSTKKENIFARQSTSSKKERRNEIGKQYEVLLLVGDNLNDFADQFDDKDVQERLSLTDSNHSQFGDRYIVLPNPMYGDWEGAIYNYNWSKDDVAKSLDRKKSLLSY